MPESPLAADPVSPLGHAADAEMLLPSGICPGWRGKHGPSTRPWGSPSSHIIWLIRNPLVPLRDVHQQAESLDTAG